MVRTDSEHYLPLLFSVLRTFCLPRVNFDAMFVKYLPT